MINIIPQSERDSLVMQNGTLFCKPLKINKKTRDSFWAKIGGLSRVLSRLSHRGTKRDTFSQRTETKGKNAGQFWDKNGTLCLLSLPSPPFRGGGQWDKRDTRR